MGLIRHYITRPIFLLVLAGLVFLFVTGTFQALWDGFRDRVERFAVVGEANVEVAERDLITAAIEARNMQRLEELARGAPASDLSLADQLNPYNLLLEQPQATVGTDVFDPAYQLRIICYRNAYTLLLETTLPLYEPASPNSIFTLSEALKSGFDEIALACLVGEYPTINDTRPEMSALLTLQSEKAYHDGRLLPAILSVVSENL